MTEQLPAVDEAQPRSRKTLLIIGGITALVIVLGGAAAFAFQKLSGGGTQPHDVLPASVVAYARVDADPSANQKIAILRLVRKFPELAKELGIKNVDQDVREPLLKDLVGECNLDYDKDVKPWIGHRIGVAYDAELETPIVAVQVTDEDKARTGINQLADCEGPDAKTGIAFLDGYAIVTPRKADAAAVSAAAKKAPLADKAAYVKDVEELGEQGVISAWADVEGLAEIDELASELGTDLETAFAGSGTVAMTLRASSSYLEIASIGRTDDAPEVSNNDDLRKLPADTALAFSISGLGDDLTKEFENGFMEGFNAGIEEEGLDPETELQTFEDELGLNLPEDLQTLLGDGLTLAVGSRNLETLPALGSPQDVSQLDIGLKLTTDPVKGADLAKRLVDLAGEVGFALTATPTDDGVVIATNATAAETFSGNGGLGDSANFKGSMKHSGGLPAMFVNLDAILDALMSSNPPPDVEEVLTELEPLSSFGASGTYDDGVFRATMRLALD